MPEQATTDLDDLQGDLLVIAQALSESDPARSTWLVELSRQAQALEKKRRRLEDQNRQLHGAVAAALLFHSGSPWTGDMQTQWWNLTQSSEATTKVLCDTLRAAQAAAGATA